MTFSMKKASLCNVAECKKPMGHVGPHTQPQCIWNDNNVQCIFPKGHEGDHSYDCEPPEEDEEAGDEEEPMPKKRRSFGQVEPEDVEALDKALQTRAQSKAVVEAFGKVFEALDDLTPEQRTRVIKAACVILDITMPPVQRTFR